VIVLPQVRQRRPLVGSVKAWSRLAIVLIRAPPRVHVINDTMRSVSTRGYQRRQALLAAARELLAEGGVRLLTVERVAERSGIAKTTIYRRWRHKNDLALAVLIDMVESIAPTPDLGDARAELIAFVDTTVAVLGDTLMGPVMQGLVSDLATDPALSQPFRERVLAVRLADLDHVIERGVARGELRADADYELLRDLVFAPVYYRLLLSGEPLTTTLAERVVDALLPAFAARELRPPSTRRRRRSSSR
jgi:AcrR family transcriptional regulator